MDKDEYFQKESKDDSYNANDEQLKGTPPEGTKSEDLLQYESEIYQSQEKFHVGEGPAVPNEGQFSLPPMK